MTREQVEELCTRFFDPLQDHVEDALCSGDPTFAIDNVAFAAKALHDAIRKLQAPTTTQEGPSDGE